MKSRRNLRRETLFWDIIDEEGREAIIEWSLQRRFNSINLKRLIYRNEFLAYTFTWKTIKTFFRHFNSVMLFQMTLAIGAVYLSTRYNCSFDIYVHLFVSPIVFPLAFAINADFQRREKALDDLANFKAAVMTWFFCMRDWRKEAHLEKLWMQAVHLKIKSLLYYTRKYLMTKWTEKRRRILGVIYENFSDTSQLIELVRKSDLPTNTALVARIHLVINSMYYAFERLRIIREYRSPRSIRSFNKVFIFFLPALISPYFVHLGKKTKNEWSPYYISVLIAFVFSALQGVHDKLDDPFDGVSDDDINLSSLDEWTCQSIDANLERSFTC